MLYVVRRRSANAPNAYLPTAHIQQDEAPATLCGQEIDSPEWAEFGPLSDGSHNPLCLPCEKKALEITMAAHPVAKQQPQPETLKGALYGIIHEYGAVRGDLSQEHSRDQMLDKILEAVGEDLERIHTTIATATGYNAELRPDGTEDPQMAAYVQGMGDAASIVKEWMKR